MDTVARRPGRSPGSGKSFNRSAGTSWRWSCSPWPAPATPIAVETLANTVAFGVLMWPVVVIAGILMSRLGSAAAIRAMQVYVVECVQRRLFVRVAAAPVSEE